MEHPLRNELEARLRQALREHQHEGLHMVGGADQLVHRLVAAVEDWIERERQGRRKSA